MRVLKLIIIAALFVSCIQGSKLTIADLTGNYQCRGFYNSGQSLKLNCDSTFEYTPYINTPICGSWKIVGSYVILNSSLSDSLMDYNIIDSNRMEKLSTDSMFTRVFCNEKWLYKRKSLIDPNFIMSDYSMQKSFKKVKRIKCHNMA
jgi:hypothetical protein